MTEILETLTEDSSPPATLLESLRKRRLETLDETTKRLEIPGYNGDLFAEYRMLDPKELERLGKKVVREFKKSRADLVLYGATDSLITACVAIHVRDEQGELVPLHEVLGEDNPIVFDVRLANTLGFEPGPTARAIVFDTFCRRDMAIIQQNVALSNWMSGIENSPLGDDDLGEA